MADKVKVTYADLDTVVAHISDLYSQTEEMLQQVINCVENLRGGGWIGLGANSFYDEMDSLVTPSIKRLAMALDEASNMTKHVGSVFGQAEDDACAQFRKLE